MSLHHWYRRGRVDSPHLNPLTARGSHNLLPHILNMQLNFNATCNLSFLVNSHSSFSPKLWNHPWLFSSFLCLRLNQHILSFTVKIHPDSSYFCFTTDITLVTSPSPLMRWPPQVTITSHPLYYNSLLLLFLILHLLLPGLYQHNIQNEPLKYVRSGPFLVQSRTGYCLPISFSGRNKVMTMGLKALFQTAPHPLPL